MNNRLAIIHMIFPTANEAMTKWWLKVTTLCYFLSYYQPEYLEDYFNFVKGVCAASGCCVFIGYYVFSYIYNCCHEPNLTKQFYINNFATFMSYSNYLMLDVVIHIILPVVTYYFWHNHITLFTSTVAFLFHRCWSIVNSNFTSIYLDGSAIYNVNCLPVWGWRTVYIGEFLVLVLSTILAFGLQEIIQ
jgi:hypothetical protein